MNVVDKAFATQVANIETKTGKSLAELVKLVKSSGLVKHGEIRDMLKAKLGLGHGDANTVTHMALDPSRIPGAASTAPAGGDPAAEFYTGAKAALKPIHNKIMSEIKRFGEFEIAPKKTYLSLRRKKQFAMVGPRDEHAGGSRPQREGTQGRRPPRGATREEHVQLQDPRCGREGGGQGTDRLDQAGVRLGGVTLAA
jgi:hypothetical protein